MVARLLVVSGTGTEIGKTHVSEALLMALGANGLRASGIKPVESGVGTEVTDAQRLRAASSFHVKHSGVALPDPISPHLAARRAGIPLNLDAIARDVQAARSEPDILLVELPGGLFTPLTDQLLNADLAATLAPDFLLLLGPDRLGVLHDTLACVRAATAMGLSVGAVALVTTANPDVTAGTNEPELRRLLPVPVLPTIPRGAPSTLAQDPALDLIVRSVLR